MTQFRASEVCFPDCPVEHFVASASAIEFRTDGFFAEGEGLVAKKCDVSVMADQSITGRAYTHENEEWLSVEPATVVLRSIDEWAAQEAGVRFAGFDAATGLWTELNASRGTVTVRAI